jgi:hypothetical protein
MIAVQGGQDPSVSAPRAQPHGGPTALRIILGTQLRRLREAKGISRHSAGDTIRASEAKMSRLESGRVGSKQRDVADLLTLYGVTDPHEREVFFALARQASSAGWWHKYSDVLPGWFEMYVGLEQAASVIRAYQVQFVPGLFQTRDYARAVTRLGHLDASAAEVDMRVNLRMSRQELLTKADAPRVWAVMDEAALQRAVGGQQVMRAQLERLIHLTQLPNVTLQLMPFAAGGHVAAGGPFSILRFSAPDLQDIAYLEQLTSALYLDKRADVRKYQKVMDQLCIDADSPADTQKTLARIIEEM